MKKKTMKELKKLKETFIDVFDEWNTTDIEVKAYLSSDWYSTFYKTIEMPTDNGPRCLFSVMNITELNDEDTDNGCIFDISLWHPDEDYDCDSVFECSEDEIEEACDVICDWIVEHAKQQDKELERLNIIVDAFNMYKPFERFKEDYTWKQFKFGFDLPKSWSIAKFKKEAKRATIKLIGKV